ncbi:hypothetical protein IDJ77_06450 [Mucilaginibacter sp. ZT4R22]|uniref:Transmembrane family 220 protein n=1 Tax=Mucilaginibacter pankratovii TaxID=2772110 RepID=A0ABR7WM89_9SPHI|nr:hypothetical protein [Mucilaginibacter pankratovii]MBD1363444.1 hypothetical protein [Mucilaginibacter pankratovii]
MFSFLLTLLGIGILTSLLKSILGLSFNFVFMLGRPYLWIGIAIITGFLFVLLCWVFNWSVTVLQWSALLSFIWLLNNRPKGDIGKEMYSIMDIKHGDLLYKTGACLFLFSAVVTFMSLYGEVVTTHR